MKSDIQAKLDAIKAPFSEQLAKIEEIPLAVEAGEKAAWDEGFVKGQESMVLPDPTDPTAQYTQADMDALAAQVRLEKDNEYKDKMDNLNAQISDLSTKVGNLENQLAQAGEVAVGAFKADLAAKYEALQVAETEAETGFGDLLK